MLDRLPAEIGCVDFLAGLDDRAATARVRVNRSNSLSPSPQRIARCSEARSSENRASISRMASLLCRQTSRHMVGSDAARRVKSRKPEAEYLMTSDLVTASQVVGGADDVVGDDVRQMRDDGQHHVVVRRGPSCRCWQPQRRQNSESVSSAAGSVSGQRREDAPAVLEQVGETGIGSRLFRAGERMAGDEMHAGRHVRLHLCDDRALVEPTSVRMAPGFSAGAISLATSPEAPTGTDTMTRSASRTASAASAE